MTTPIENGGPAFVCEDCGKKFVPGPGEDQNPEIPMCPDCDCRNATDHEPAGGAE